MADGSDAGHTTGSAVPGEGHPAGFPPFQSHSFPGQLLWFAIAFGLLYYLMSKVLLPQVGSVLENRRERIARDLDEAHAMRGEAERAGAAYEAALSEARDKAKGIAQATRDSLAAETDSRRKTLEAELGGKLAAAEATIRARSTEAMSHVREVAGEAASAIVERLTGRAPDRAAIESALSRSAGS